MLLRTRNTLSFNFYFAKIPISKIFFKILISYSDLQVNGQFDEKMRSEKTNELKEFFFLGPENNWKKLLDKNTIKNINKNFSEELKDLNYEI